MINPKLMNDANDRLMAAILALQTKEESYCFFEDLCTVAELQALAQRLEVADMLRAGCTYEKITTRTGASTATISRVKRALEYGADGYKVVLERLGK